MIGWLRRRLDRRREARERADLDALKVRYHTFRILLANHERALDRLGAVEAALTARAPTGELAGRVEELLAVTFEMVDGATRLGAREAETLYARQLRLEEELRAVLETAEEAGRGPSCLPLSDPLAAAEVGGKAAGLSQLTRNGFPVPDGFAVTARACTAFLRETGLDVRIREALGPAGRADAALGPACAAVRRDILAASLPEWLREDLRNAAARLAPMDGADAPPSLAARSSALAEDQLQHSFAGQFTSELNLTPDTLEEGFLKVMAGAFGERAVAYRLEAGLPATTLDMAVLVQVMVPARAAGVVFTIDPVHPDMGRMFVSAVPGLGVLAVNGSVPVDVYRVDREDPDDVITRLARKTRKAVPAAGGGLTRETVSREEAEKPVLEPAVLARLVRLSLAAESLAGSWRDLEYALDASGRLWLLQSRPARILWGRNRPPAPPKTLFSGGMAATPGRCLGRARHIEALPATGATENGPVIAVLPTADPALAAHLPRWQGVVVAGGNPADHLSTLARETGRPMLTRARGALEAIPDNALIVLDADATQVTATPPAIGDIDELLSRTRPAHGPSAGKALTPGRARVRDLVCPAIEPSQPEEPADAAACRSLRDIILYAHDAAGQALFATGDGLPDGALSQARPLRGLMPFAPLVLDLGGGLREEPADRPIAPEELASIPLAALWRGLTATGPQGEPGTSPRPARVLAARDYVNFTLAGPGPQAGLDAVCGPRARGNYARAVLATPKSEADTGPRVARCLETILQQAGFLVKRRNGHVLAVLTDASEEATAAALTMLGRLLVLLPHLDTLLPDDAATARVATAFLAGESL